MRIQHNIAAMNSYRNYTANTGALAKNLEKLSSGYKINRAGDDAAGLAISEKMRAQISGLKQAQSNVKDGISLVKTAEGALQEVQDMMNRMVTLATQSANGTYDNNVDRANLQKEVESLKAEIDRIADSSNFNGTKLLDGSLDAASGSNVVGEEGKAMQDMVVSAGSGTAVAAATAAAAKQTFTAAAGAAASKYDAFEVTFSDNDGQTYSFTLVSNAVGTGAANTAVATELEKALDGDSTSTSALTLGAASTGDGATALKKFEELFTVTDNSDGTITIQAKDADSKATVNSIKQDSSKALAAVDPAKGAALGVVNEGGVSGDWTKVTVSATGTTEASFTVGDKVYTTSDAVNGSGASEESKAADLVAQLRKDGYSIQYKNGDDNFYFTDPSQLHEAQKGTQITNTADDKWDVNATAGTAGGAIIVMNDATENNADVSATVTYLDADGKEVTKTFNFNTGADGDAAAANLVAAMKEDADFAATFDVVVTSDTNNDKVTLTNKGYGVAYGLQSFELSDKAGANVAITEGKSTGKELTVATGETIKKGDQITVDGKTYQFVEDMAAKVDDGVIKVKVGTGATANADSLTNLTAALKQNGVEAKFDTNKITFADNKYTAGNGDGGLQLQIGDTADDYNQIKVSIGNMHVDALGIGDLDISKQENAKEAVGRIKEAINKVSSTRGDLGAIQNRLEHTTNNLAVMTENIQDAESTIRDVDIADEMTTYTKNNILLQSAQAMLAQANQMPQGVLQLLQ